MSNHDLTTAERASLRLFGSQMAQGIRTAVDAADLPTLGDDLVLSMIHDGVAYFEAFQGDACGPWTSSLHYCEAGAWIEQREPLDDQDEEAYRFGDWT